MKFVLDENFPISAKALLEELGHEAILAREAGLLGHPDTDLLTFAIDREAGFITTDRDYFHTLGRQFPEHFGIVVIALRQPTRANILAKLNWFFGHLHDDQLPGHAFQLRDHVWNVYPAMETSL